LIFGVKVKVKVKFTLEQATKAQRGSKGIQLYSFFNLGTRWRWVVNATPWPLYPRERIGTLVWEAGWAPGLVWTGAENLAVHRDSIPGPSNP
jgi:hypothetical protein